MYLGDFRAFLARNQAPQSRLAILTMGAEPFDAVTIFDEQKYERVRRNHRYSWGFGSEFIETGYGYQDLMRIGFICNVGLWSQNWVPEYGGEGVYNEERDDWDVRPARGYRQAIENLIIEGCLCPNKEVFAHTLPGELHAKRSKVPEWCRLYSDLPRE